MTFSQGFNITLSRGTVLMGNGRTNKVITARHLADDGLITIEREEWETYSDWRGNKARRKIAVYVLCPMGESVAAELRAKQ